MANEGQNKTRVNALKGIEAVAQALRLESFPSDKGALYYSVGDIEVEAKQGGFVPVRDVLDRIGKDNFNSAEEAIDDIRQAA